MRAGGSHKLITGAKDLSSAAHPHVDVLGVLTRHMEMRSASERWRDHCGRPAANIDTPPLVGTYRTFSVRPDMRASGSQVPELEQRGRRLAETMR